ncbi:MAG: ATP-binding protein [Bacillota bacterium]
MKKLLILSGKGGTGKTTISASLIKLAKAKAVADCDVDAPNLHIILNQTSSPQVFDFMGGDKASVTRNRCNGCGVCVEKCKFDAIKIKLGKAEISEFFCEGCGVCSLVCKNGAIVQNSDIAGERKLYTSSDDDIFSTATLKMGRGNSGKLVTDVKQAMLKNAKDCELSIIDGSPGLGCPVIASASGMDVILVVAEPSESGISDLKRLLKTLNSFGVTIAICVNKFDTNTEKTTEIEDFCKGENISFIGKIPYDKNAIIAVNQGLAVVDIDCKAGDEIKKIYEKITQIMA